MKNILKNFLLTFILLTLFFSGLVKGQDRTADEKDLIKTVEKLLFAAGNFNIEVLDDMISDKAMLGISFLKDGTLTNSEMTIDEYFEDTKNRELRPYSEIPTDYDIIVTEGRLASVRADAILYQFGVPRNREINHMTLMKEGEHWKFLNISWTAYGLPQEKRKFDLNIFGKSYAQACCSQRPEFVSLFFAENGSLSVNDGTPAKGRTEISKIAESFMTAFPDIIVTMDSLVTTLKDTKFYWTFTGTKTGPGGTGKEVKIKGVELWQFNDGGLIKESSGSFDVEEYERQIKYGFEN